MTRFARAKGSKASNQRLPDESTPWSELKNQIQGTSETPEPTSEGTNWKQVINTEKKVEENVNSVWCDFSDSENNQDSNKFKNKKKTYRKNVSETELNSVSNEPSKKNKKRRIGKNADIKHGDFDDNSSKRAKFTVYENFSAVEGDDNQTSSNTQNSECIGDSKKLSNDPSDWSEGFDWKESGKTEQSLQERKINKDNSKQERKFIGSKNWSVTGRQFKKFSADSHVRRKADYGDEVLNVNGQKITVTRLDGFYIRKEDADRIKELERDMLKRGIPKEEIRAVVKRERRNAEKSLARQKKKVCFHCRKGGHNLSSCPKLSESGAQTIGSGICYKCGSTEHSHINCRVASGQTFKFATCFICKEEGHIAKQCPDNPRGLYPDGGACKLCGDVTHFKKDCPQLPEKSSVTIGTIDRNIETLGDVEDTNLAEPVNQKKKNKVIKFK